MMTDVRMFPILQSSRDRLEGYPGEIPWDLLAPHEQQARRNHGQSLERLAQRGGLGWSEIELILADRPWTGRIFVLPGESQSYTKHEAAAADRVLELANEWWAEHQPEDRGGLSPWRPIETAPKDGTRLWLYFPHKHEDDRQCMGWWRDGYWIDCYDANNSDPTHWLPLPRPPDQAAARKAGGG